MSLRMVEIINWKPRPSSNHRAAVLACSFSADATHACSGGLDTVVKEYVFRFNDSKKKLL